MRVSPLGTVAAVLLLAACSGASGSEATGRASEPIALGAQACAVCGMIVREQPPPRGQVRHRDGTHLHFCSLGDMRSHVQAPSPHGAAVEVWVEALPSDFDLDHPTAAALPWISAIDASFVVGFERERIMGVPTLSFAGTDDATAAAERVGGHTVGWESLRSTPAHQVPPPR